MKKRTVSIATRYGQYKKLFQKEKKIHNIKNNVRQLTRKQFEAVIKEAETNSIKKILAKQTILATAKLKKDTLKRYNKAIKANLKPGDFAIYDDTYFGENNEETEGLGYHRTLSGLLKDRDAVHFLISDRIIAGEDRYDVLADFGYRGD